MAGGKFVPKNEKEELLYYKGLYNLQKSIQYRADLMGQINSVDQDIAKQVVQIQKFVSWRELGKMLSMTEAQARGYLRPLMEDEVK